MDYQHVYFLPWCGVEYESSGFRGRRLLIVGESHYDVNPSREFTKDCILDKCDKPREGPAFWTHLKNRIGGE